MKNIVFLGIFLALAMVFGNSHLVMGQEALFRDYGIAVVQEFNVPTNVSAPDAAGSEIAEKVVYQLRRYSEKFKLFEMVVKEGIERDTFRKESPYHKRGSQGVHQRLAEEAHRAQSYPRRGMDLHQRLRRPLPVR